jgi:two-component system chemotaxis response regulator CheY
VRRAADGSPNAIACPNHLERRMRMMIVDDSNMIRSRIARLVQDGQIGDVHVVAMAKDGADAVQQARKLRPAIVTMDLTMPEMDGVACIQNLMALDAKVAILVVSALSDKSTAISALRLGARGFLPKPFTDEQLRLALLDVMDAA